MAEASTEKDVAFKLNDHCLSHAFMELPIHDHIQLSRVCWSKIKCITLRNEYMKDDWILNLWPLNEEKPIIFTELRCRHVESILILVGRFLNELVIDYPNHGEYLTRQSQQCLHLPPVRFIAKHCINLTKLFLDVPMSNDDLDQIFSRCEKLEIIRVTAAPALPHEHSAGFLPTCLKKLPKTVTDIAISMYRYGSPRVLANFAIKALRDLHNLQKLEFSRIVFDLGSLKTLAINQSLREVSFTHCNFVDSISEIADFQNLTSLKIINTTKVSEDFLCRLSTNCQKLQHLTISNWCDPLKNPSVDCISQLANLPVLKTLNIDQSYNLNVGDMSKMTTLTLFTCCECRSVDNHAIISLLEHANNLEYLGIGNTSVTEVVLMAADIVARLHHINDGPPLNVYINSGLIEKYGDQKHSPLLKIIRYRKGTSIPY